MIDKKTVAKDLLSINAVFLRPNQPFTWASGIQSPIYCDNRMILSDPAVRGRVEQGLADIIQDKFPDCQLVAGTSTAGIPHAALVAELLSLPMCYVRVKAKEHGRENKVEGRANPGQKVVVIEDLISTGGSVIEVVDTLRDAGCDVLGIVSIFTYDLDAAKQKMDANSVVWYSLSDYHALIEQAMEEGFVQQSDVAKLDAFRKNPRDPGWMEL